MSDAALIQIVDAALAEAARKAGPWLACRLGCTECCMGPFPITLLDARRLRDGLAELATREPVRAARVRRRARAYRARFERDYPVDTVARLLADDGHADQEPCPALDPETGACDLYAARPIACRTFGPPIRFAGEDLGVCELCFQGASDEQIAACAVEIPQVQWEGAQADGETIVGWILAGC
jgi:Fe-S-cluster containining protein